MAEENKTTKESTLTDEQKSAKNYKKIGIAVASGIAVALGIYLEVIDISYIAAMFASQ